MNYVRRLAVEKMVILQEILDCGSVKSVARKYNISQALLYTWRKRFIAHGFEGLEQKQGQRKKVWQTYEPLPDFEIEGRDWIVKNLKHSSNKIGQDPSPWYNFDLLIPGVVFLGNFSFYRKNNSVRGFWNREGKWPKPIVQLLGEMPKILGDAIEMQLQLNNY